jgi:CRP-like cAMP-binding protein
MLIWLQSEDRKIMYEVLKKGLLEHVHLTDDEWELCKNSFRPKRMLKRQFLLQEGDICRDLAFVEKGALYSYSVDSKGNQHVISFAFEGWWMANLQSFFTGDPTKTIRKRLIRIRVCIQM